jgi:ribosome recycling factor
MNKITDKTTNKTMDKTTNKIANQITMLGTGNATISQINTDFLFGYLGESFSRLWQE